MEDYTDYIEKFLRGQMNQQEEVTFKASLVTDVRLRSLAFILAYLLRKQKSG